MRQKLATRREATVRCTLRKAIGKAFASGAERRESASGSTFAMPGTCTRSIANQCRMATSSDISQRISDRAA